jgi:hypothetical protein
MASATADTSSSSSSSTTNTSRMSLSLASPRAGAGSASTSLSPKGSGGGATPLSPRGAASPLSPRGAGGATGPPLTATQTQQQRRVNVLTEILQTETAYVDDLVLVTEVCAREIDLDRLSQHPTHCRGVLWCDVMWYGVVRCSCLSIHFVPSCRMTFWWPSSRISTASSAATRSFWRDCCASFHVANGASTRMP